MTAAITALLLALLSHIATRQMIVLALQKDSRVFLQRGFVVPVLFVPGLHAPGLKGFQGSRGGGDDNLLDCVLAGSGGLQTEDSVVRRVPYKLSVQVQGGGLKTCAKSLI